MSRKTKKVSAQREVTTQFFAELRLMGVTHVRIDYRGSGDDGEYETVQAYSSYIDLEDEIGSIGEDSKTVKLDDTVAERLQWLMQQQVEQRYAGFENDSGGEGHAVLNLLTGKLTGLHAYYIETTEYDKPWETNALELAIPEHG